MNNKNWITYSEAAKILKKPEEHVKQLVEQGIITGYKDAENNVFYVDKDHLVGWTQRRKMPRVEVTEIYNGIRRTLLEYHKTIYAKEQARHAGVRGALYETFVRDFLEKHLPQKFYIGTGQVLSSNPVLDDRKLVTDISNQMDVVIFDAFNHPVLLPKYELYPIEGTLSVIEVKSRLDKSTLIGTQKNPGALANITSAKRLISLEARTINSTTSTIINDEHFAPPLGIIFAFDSTDPKTIAKQWEQWNATKELNHRTDMICLLKQETLIVDTNRFDQLFDSHQFTMFDPIVSSEKNKLVGIKSPVILFFFVNLLLSDLRKMSVQSQRLSSTTPSSYFRNAKITSFTIDNARDPRLKFSNE